MYDYDKLLDITKNKLLLSREFLQITENMQQIVQNKNYEVQDFIEKRQKLIEEISSLDDDFIVLLEHLKSDENFENTIKKYPKLGDYISELTDNFKKSYEKDSEIMPLICYELDEVRLQLKKVNNNSMVQDKYTKDSMQKVEGANFGMFIDEMK